MNKYTRRRLGVAAVIAGLLGSGIVATLPEEAAAAKYIRVESTRRTAAIVHGTNSTSSPATVTGRAVVDQPGGGVTRGLIDGRNCTVYVPPRTSMTWRQVIPVVPDQYGHFNNTGRRGYEKLLEKGSDCSLGTFRITFVGLD